MSLTSGESRSFTSEKLERGGRLYTQHCAGCHGIAAQGVPGWQEKGADGRFGSPPLNGTGHAWHHSEKSLKLVIQNGMIKFGGSMPPFGDKLAEEEVDALFSWMISLWPDEIYNHWRERENKPPAKGNKKAL
ncbi:c-type cytochrome [Thermodesulfobacteriota bacterium]